MNRLIAILPTKAEDAISRQELCARLGYGDRSVRRLIAKARKQGVPVIPNTVKGGYYLGTTQEDISHLRRVYLGRTRAEEAMLRKMAKWPLEGQSEIS